MLNRDYHNNKIMEIYKFKHPELKIQIKITQQKRILIRTL